MPRPAWNDIETQAAVFAASWAGESHERAEAQTFWSDFLALFGIDRRRHGGYFEYAVRLDAARGFIDMFLPGKLLAEHKSAGRDLRRAQQQALDYLPGIPDAQLPEAIVVSDFATFQLLNLTSRQLVEFPLGDLPKHVREFAFLLDEETSSYVEESPVNRAAAEQMAALHDALRETNYRDHKLRLFLVRLVFCNFADDARIFPRGAFEHYLRTRTREDGSDLGPLLGKLFETLNTPNTTDPASSTPTSPPCRTSTAACSPNRSQCPTSTGPCGRRCSSQPRSTGRSRLQRSSARCSRA